MTLSFEKKRTKILATLGPSTDSVDVLQQMIRNGLNGVRVNFSHGSHAEHAKRIEMAREAAKRENTIISIFADLQGPKIRVARFKSQSTVLVAGQTFTLDAAWPDDAGDDEQVGIDYKDLVKDVSTDDVLLLDDGRIQLLVKNVTGSRIRCEVTVGGKLSNNKGINKRGGGLSAPALTEKDKVDLDFVLTKQVDYVAISYPRSRADMDEARALLGDKHKKVGLVAKVERTEAVENLDEIIIASDGVMVARGDLAVEIGDAQVPVVQKRMIQRARALDRFVITATQMMESMITANVPTRAEVSDVANAVLDCTDVVMLSAESAVGAHPVEVVRVMADVCLSAEKAPETVQSGHRMECCFSRVDEAIAMATMYTANHLNIKAIIALTESGSTPLWMSRIRSAIPIYALSEHPQTLGRTALYAGVHPLSFPLSDCNRDDVNQRAVDALLAVQACDADDLVILTKGDFIGVRGGANAMKIIRVQKEN